MEKRDVEADLNDAKYQFLVKRKIRSPVVAGCCREIRCARYCKGGPGSKEKDRGEIRKVEDGEGSE